MLAVQANLLTLLDGKKQFIIPIYQRTYSWTERQCRQLWDDIVRTAQDDKIPAHFIGSVVYIKASLYDTPTTTTPQMLVIDGQQRLTTLSLLLIALREALRSSDGSAEVTPDEVEDYLTNKHGRDNLRHKLVLTQTDKDALAALIDGKPMPSIPSARVVVNYQFFKNQIQNSTLRLDTVFHGIQKLMLVDISLDRSHDNPQLIFESLNSTGLDLSQADLIRNFVLMGQEPDKQTALYEHYWYPMEESFGHADSSGLFDRFMRDYLTITTGSIPNMGNVYVEFKKYVQKQPTLSIEDVVKDVSNYSRIFVTLAFATANQRAINLAIEDINALRVDVAYPFLMEVYRDFNNQALAGTDFLRILRLIESYVFRRAVCEIPTNSHSKTFAGLYKLIDKAAYVESLEAALLSKDSYQRFPSDEEFKAQLVSRDLYSTRNITYLLDKLENFGRKELVEVNGYTIEHIMPQTENLDVAWKQDLGADWKQVHDVYLHTLGNLTLTAYNSEYSARPFLIKRDLKDRQGQPCGFAHSPLHLNQGIGILDHWNEDEIKKRASLLADKALKIWAAPILPADILKKYQPSQIQATTVKYTYDTYAEELFGTYWKIFDALRTQILGIDPDAIETYLRTYVTFHIGTKFLCNAAPKQTRIRILLNISHDQIDDPHGMTVDATKFYSQEWAHGLSVIDLKSEAQIRDVINLVKQAFQAVRKDDDGITQVNR